MPTIEDQAICVRTWDWSETSQTAVLITREHGMVRVLAKGSKRDRSLFSGGLELCTHGQFSAIIRPNSELALLTNWDLLEPMRGIRQSLAAYNASMLGIDLIPRLIQDHDPHPTVHDSLLELLRFCDQPLVSQRSASGDHEAGILSMLAWYQWIVLVAIGAMPIVDHDACTGAALTPSEVFGFSAQFGGVTQDPITVGPEMAHFDSAAWEDVWRVRARTVEIMASLGENPSSTLLLSCSNDEICRLVRLLGAFIRERTGSDIPAMNWLLNG